MTNAIIKVSGTVPANATTSDIVSIDIPEDGLIQCIGGLLVPIFSRGAAPSTNESLSIVAELSFLSTHQIGSNDARGTIAGIGVAVIMVFSEAAETGGGGAKISEQNSLCIEGGIPVNAGERIHLHGSSSDGSLTATATFILYMKFVSRARRSPSRR